MTSMTLNVLGCPRLSGDGGTVDLPPAGQLLLGCVALHANDAPLRRERLAEMLWPDMDAQNQKARLRTALWRIKKATCGALDDVLIVRKDTLVFEHGAPLIQTHRTFEREVMMICAKPLANMSETDAATLLAMVESYNGPLMEGHDAPWIAPMRERFSDLYSAALERQIKYLRATGRDHESIRSSHELLAIDPYREDVHAALITLYGQSGRPKRALRQYQSCRTLMEKDLGVPTPTARRSLDGILKEGPTPDLGAILRALEAGVRDLNTQIQDLKSTLHRREDTPNLQQPRRNSLV